MPITARDLIEEPSHYGRWRRKVDLLVNSGRFEEALELCDQIDAWAEARPDKRYRDQAFCWRAGVLIATGDGDRAAPRLRRILMGHSHPIPQLSAAYYLSLHHDGRGESEKSRLYARRALRHARECGLARCLIRCLNLYANCLFKDGEYSAAARGYDEALALQASPPAEGESDHPDWIRGVLMANLGGSLVLLDRPREALGYLAEALECLDRQPEGLRSDALVRRVLLGLSFGYLNLERPLIAGRYARWALEDGGEPVTDQVRKGGLFLLGEASKLAGSEERALVYYSSLQEEFYPDMPDVVNLLLLTDARGLVNIWE
ncbi:MAG: tetratricopeptide repeat protein [Acidobacteriota bacterium]